MNVLLYAQGIADVTIKRQSGHVNMSNYKLQRLILFISIPAIEETKDEPVMHNLHEGRSNKFC